VLRQTGEGVDNRHDGYIHATAGRSLTHFCTANAARSAARVKEFQRAPRAPEIAFQALTYVGARPRREHVGRERVAEGAVERPEIEPKSDGRRAVHRVAGRESAEAPEAQQALVERRV